MRQHPARRRRRRCQQAMGISSFIFLLVSSDYARHVSAGSSLQTRATPPSTPETLFSGSGSLSPGYLNLPVPLVEFKLEKSRSIYSSGGRTGVKSQNEVTDLSIFPVSTRNGTALPSYDTVYTFDQLIDHSNPQLGTFKQRYYFTQEFYEPGGPIFFAVPSEASLDRFDGSVTNSTVNGWLAQLNSGASLVLEHRFFGESNPYNNLSSQALSVLTLDQAMADIYYFAENVQLPMAGGDKMSPSEAPWVLVGGSYAGALVVWTMRKYPGVFAAGWASSAVVQATNYFWSYFDIIRQFAPANCTADLEAITTYLDNIFVNGTADQQTTAKTTLGLQDVTYPDDVMSAIRAPIYSWQDLQPNYEEKTSGFYAFCNYLEYDHSVGAYETTGSGLGVEKAFAAFGNWTQYEIRTADCNGRENLCYGTHDASSDVLSSTELNNQYRSWAWLYCHFFGWLFSGAPKGWPTISSRLTTPDSEFRTCSLFFADTFPMGTPANSVLNNTQFNIEHGGWDVKTKNVFFSNGRKDPWRGVTVSSDVNNRKSTTAQPVAVAAQGFHCSDLTIAQGEVDSSVLGVQTLGAAYIYDWLGTWYTNHTGISRPTNVTVQPDPSTLKAPAFTPAKIPTNITNATYVNYVSWSAVAGPTGGTSNVATLPTASAGELNDHIPNSGYRRPSPWLPGIFSHHSPQTPHSLLSSLSNSPLVATSQYFNLFCNSSYFVYLCSFLLSFPFTWTAIQLALLWIF